MTNVLDAKALVEQEFAALEARIKNLSRAPVLAVVLVGENKASAAFVRVKQRAAQRIGIDCRLFTYQEGISAKEFSKKLNELAKSTKFDGMIVQLPLPPQLDGSRHSFLRIIPEDKDVDCLSERWQGRLTSGRTFVEIKGRRANILPPVASAIFKLSEKYHISFEGKNVAVVGWGDLVGKPIVPLLLARDATVTVCTSKTSDLTSVLKNSDIIISGTGKAGLIHGDMIKLGAIIFDAGYSEENGGVKGDVDKSSVEGVAGMLSASPGGIGPLTVVSLFEKLPTHSTI